MTTDNTPFYIGIDLETTGLDPRRDRIIECGVLVLTRDLDEVGSWAAAIACPSRCIERAHERVVSMHVQNKLWVFQDGKPRANPEIPRIGLDALETTLLQIRDVYAEAPVLVGSSVQFDRAFLEHWCPDLAASLSHRNLDDRTVKELGFNPPPHNLSDDHRALPDIRRTVANLRAARARMRGEA